jgi:hypothetical protein
MKGEEGAPHTFSIDLPVGIRNTQRSEAQIKVAKRKKRYPSHG